MLYRTFGKTGWDVSVVGIGTWGIGNQWGKLDDVTAFATVRSAFEHGITLFDTAESYGIPNGLSEERLGTALAGIRHRVYVVSKVGNWGKKTTGAIPRTGVDSIRISCHASLHRLKTDWLDVLLCHEGDIEDPSVYLEGFEALKKEGRIRSYGISTNQLDVLKRFNADATCSVVQLDYSLLNRKPEAELLPYCIENNIGVMVRGPLGKGLLSGRYTTQTVFTDTVRAVWHSGEKQQEQFEKQVAQVDRLKALAKPGAEMVQMALRYVISNPAVSVVIPGAKSAEQAATNAGAGTELLSDEVLKKLQGLTGLFL